MTTEALYTYFKETDGVSTDTRHVCYNRIFFCLSGENFNGNTFAKKALEQGARFVIGDDQNVLPKDERIIVVEDSLTTLQQLAAYHREQFNIPVIAITGSNGKTTTKELFYQVLSQQYEVIATKGNLNNHIGVPLTLLNIHQETTLAIIEMGANHQKEIAALAKVAQPTHGYITNFGKAHLEGFGGIEGVVKGKSELYDALRATEGTVLVDHGNLKQIERSNGIKRFTFGDNKVASFTIKAGTNDNGFCYAQWEEHVAHSQLTGQYNQTNITAAIAMGQLMGVSAQNIILGITHYRPNNNRSQWQKTEKNTLLLDAYNANPSSMEAAIQAFDIHPSTAKGVILGDMLELGPYTAKEHQKVVDVLQTKAWLPIYLVGQHFMQTNRNENQLAFSTLAAVKKHLEENPIQNQTLLIKGSRGIALEQLLDVL